MGAREGRRLRVGRAALGMAAVATLALGACTAEVADTPLRAAAPPSTPSVVTVPDCPVDPPTAATPDTGGNDTQLVDPAAAVIQLCTWALPSSATDRTWNVQPPVRLTGPDATRFAAELNALPIATDLSSRVCPAYRGPEYRIVVVEPDGAVRLLGINDNCDLISNGTSTRSEIKPILRRLRP